MKARILTLNLADFCVFEYFYTLQTIVNSSFITYQYINMNQFFKQSSLFIILTLGIYCCYLTSAIYHQKLYVLFNFRLKNPYKRFDSDQHVYFGQSLMFTIFPPLIAAIIGQTIMFVQGQQSRIPNKACLPIAAIININMFTYNQAVIQASFPAVVMAKSCSLLSVIIVGVFFSKVKDKKLKLTEKKLAIGIVATFGIVLFNLFKRQQKDPVDHAIKLFSLGNLFLVISLIGDGFLPDYQAQVKSQYKPSTIDMYANVNRFTFLISFSLAVISNKISVIFSFLMNYEDFASDVFKFSILNAVGQLFIYRMIKEFRQHIPAFVIAFRKCLTVIVNILWFHHSINKEQLIGIGFVFVAVMWQVYSNYKQKEQNNQKQIILKHLNMHIDSDTSKLLDQQIKQDGQSLK